MSKSPKPILIDTRVQATRRNGQVVRGKITHIERTGKTGDFYHVEFKLPGDKNVYVTQCRLAQLKRV